MNRFGRVIGLAILLIACLSIQAYPSTNKLQSYVFKNSAIRWQPAGYSTLLFAQQIGDSIKAEPLDSIKLKDPKMAVLYAIIPGIVVHGAGHFYAGKPKMALILVGTEAIGFVLLIRGAVSEFGENHSGGGGGFQGITGFALLLGSWIYDLIGAPLAVEKENQKLQCH